MIRQAQHNGTFYPRFGSQIESQIVEWISDVETKTNRSRIVGLIVPHAGYVYSGKCAALAYHDLSRSHIDSFIVLYPSHYGSHFDIALSPFDRYETPLGDIQVDKSLQAEFSDFEQESIQTSYHLKEHSLEIQLPFIRHFFPLAELCPIMIGRQNPQVAMSLADRMYQLLTRNDKQIAVIVSTDLSHYHTAEVARRKDNLLIQRTLDLDPESLWMDITTGLSEACGIGGILSLLYLGKLLSTAKMELIEYTHSGMSSNNHQQVVGYMSTKLVV